MVNRESVVYKMYQQQKHANDLTQILVNDVDEEDQSMKFGERQSLFSLLRADKNHHHLGPPNSTPDARVSMRSLNRGSRVLSIR